MSPTTRNIKIAVIAGDGIGPEIINQVGKIADVLNLTGMVNLILTKFPYSADHYLQTRVAIPDEFIAELEKNYDALLIGPLGDPRIPDGRHAREIIYSIRNKLDLYFSYQKLKVFDTWMNPLKNAEEKSFNFILARENIESGAPKPGGNLYRGTTHEIVTQTIIYSRRGVERFIQSVFETANKYGMKKVICAQKNSIFTHLHELWQRTFQEAARSFPAINADTAPVDTIIYDLLDDPGRFEMIAAPAESADIFYTAGLFLQGGPGLAYLCEIDPGRFGAFRIMQGSAVKIAGHNRANPFGAFLATAEMLRYLGLAELAMAVENAVTRALQRHLVTIDMGGLIGTEEVGNYLCEFIQEQFRSV